MAHSQGEGAVPEMAACTVGGKKSVRERPFLGVHQ